MIKIHPNHHMAVKHMTDEQAGKVLKSVLLHANGETVLHDDGIVQMLSDLIIKESKSRASKADRRKPDQIPSWEEFLAHALSIKKLVDQVELKEKYQAWIENDWHDGHNNKIVRWKAKLRETLKYIKERMPKPGVQPRDEEADRIKAANDAKFKKMLEDKKRENPNYDPRQEYMDRENNFNKLQTQGEDFRKKNLAL